MVLIKKWLLKLRRKSPKVGMAAHNARNRKQPETYVPSMQGNKYQVALAQITTSLGSSETSMAFAQMSVKLMNKGTHQRSYVVGMVMAQVSLKAAIKNGEEKLWTPLERRCSNSIGKTLSSPCTGNL